ncbi:hypothetical protein D9V41_08325 [Aeromicrobium phragmitis]|uniref:DUF2567 domain-containing protein n=1 Tax=Aeromicrobium phragmitis TaxID=2478914 RepID=A0A3L8PPG1_9ACTN|nr:hypothetical protein D9V41_08325 [Aeromicrobium phragmitis]
MNARSWLSAAITAVLVMAGLGAAAGLCWIVVAQPAQWEYAEQGLVLSESAAAEQFGIVAWFVAIGFVLCLVFGWVLAARRAEDGWRVVPVVIVATLLGAVVCSRVGYSFGPPDPRSVTGLQLGDQVPMQFELGSFSPMLLWTLGGLVGLVGAVFLRAPDESQEDVVTARSTP